MESVEFKISYPNKKRVRLLCNWIDSINLTSSFKKMLKDDSRFELVSDCSSVDLYVIFNNTYEYHIPEKSIIFQMEPFLFYDKTKNYRKVYTSENSFTNIEWHINKSCKELLYPYMGIKKDVLSVILSDKYGDDGHKFRVNLVKYLDSIQFPLTVFGHKIWSMLKSYNATELPSLKKDDGLFPFKYHLAVENNSIKGYTTEKLVDGILSECLTFYWGNVDCILNPNCYIRIDDKTPFSETAKIIQSYIDNDEWSKRIEIIRIEKLRIINNLTCFSRIENLF